MNQTCQIRNAKTKRTWTEPSAPSFVMADLSRQVIGNSSSPRHMVGCYLAGWCWVISWEACEASACLCVRIALSWSDACVGVGRFIGRSTLWHHNSQPMRGTSSEMMRRISSTPQPHEVSGRILPQWCKLISHGVSRCFFGYCWGLPPLPPKRDACLHPG